MSSREIEYYIWYRHAGQNTAEDAESDWRKFPKRRIDSLKEVADEVAGQPLTQLNMWGPLPRSFQSMGSELTTLCLHKHPTNDSHWIMKGISGLTALKKLCLTGNELLDYSTAIVALSTLSSLTEINLKECKLKYLPESFTKLKQLEILILSRNDLKRYSDVNCQIISELESLKELKLKYCNLIVKPGCLSKLTKLEKANFNTNDLSEEGVFEELCTLTSLTDLSLDLCKLTDSIPPSISGLKKLTKLNLYGNRFSPDANLDAIGKLHSLKTLEMSSCDITSIPRSFSELTELEVLKLPYNNFSADYSIDPIYSLESLKELDMGGSHIKSFSTRLIQLEKLEKLNLSYNDVSQQSLEDLVARLHPLKECSITCRASAQGSSGGRTVWLKNKT